VDIVLTNNKISAVNIIDPVSGKLIEKTNTPFLLFPAKHFITDPMQNKPVFEKIKLDLEERVKFFKDQGKLLEANRIQFTKRSTTTLR
jgi:excinuclease ABC subunit B